MPTERDQYLLEAYRIAPKTRLQFFVKAPLHYALLSLLTFGIYDIYWFYMNWMIVRNASKRKMLPFWRALFAIFWIWPLFRLVTAVAAQRGKPSDYSPVVLAATYVATGLTSYSFERDSKQTTGLLLVSFMLALVRIAPVLAIQQPMLEVNRSTNPAAAYEPATKAEVAIMVIGMIFYALGIYAILTQPVK